MQDALLVWQTATAQQLSEVLASIQDVQTMRNFLRDVMTEKEIIEISARFRAAQMLTQGKKYTEIIETTKLSSRTIARISEWLQKGCGGYQAAFALSDAHHSHTPPARV